MSLPGTNLIGRCPQCGKPSLIEQSNVFRPFCCERCKLLDLSAWMNGRFAIPVEPAEGDEPLLPAQDLDDPTRQ